MVEKMKKSLLWCLVCLVCLVPCSGAALAAEADAAQDAADGYVYDEAGLLTADEIADLNDEIASFMEESGWNVYAVTTDDAQGKSATDNTMAGNTEAIDNITRPAGIPVIAGEEGICSGCGVATLSISYYDIGYKAGEMAYDILVNGKDISTMDIEYAPNVTKEYNAAICSDLGITVPDDYVAIDAE